jgi:hypothetical protein
MFMVSLHNIDRAYNLQYIQMLYPDDGFCETTASGRFECSAGSLYGVNLIFAIVWFLCFGLWMYIFGTCQPDKTEKVKTHGR